MKRRHKKVIKHRGKASHGWGAKKKHRGAGSRGGRGMAGTGKRADQKKTSINPQEYFGRYGFKHTNAVTINTINIGELERKLHALIANKTAEEKSGIITIDLNKINVQKLLSMGDVKSKLGVIVNCASAKAVDKIKKAGGSIDVLQEIEDKDGSEDKGESENNEDE